MIAKLCGDFLQFLVGFDVFAEFEPAEADLKWYKSEGANGFMYSSALLEL